MPQPPASDCAIVNTGRDGRPFIPAGRHAHVVRQTAIGLLDCRRVDDALVQRRTMDRGSTFRPSSAPW